jgi:hypothetical protein
MTKKELNDCIVRCITLSDPPYPTVKIEKLVEEIWGQPFDGETDARIAEFKGEMSAISQAHEMWLRESFTDSKTPTQHQ